MDEYVRLTGMSRAKLSKAVGIAASTLYKARALDPHRGRIHWTTLAVIGAYMGLIADGEIVTPDHPVVKLLGAELISSRGRGTPRYNDVFRPRRQRARHLRLVS